MTTQEQLDLNTTVAIIAIKIKAIKLTLSKEQLNTYNNIIEEELKAFEPILKASYKALYHKLCKFKK